ncbi:MAG: LysR family transcriptional regulator [Chloroflexi bacterium]|nr:LysR family transcriptional regulator [Chloroflexota bacterium]
MDLEQLRTFLLVVEHASLSAAASQLGISQPAVSKRIQSLEQELGLPLLVRDVRGARPNAAGQRVADGARAILAEQAQMLERLRLLQQEARTELALAASTIPGEHLAPELLGDLQVTLPGLAVHLWVGDTAGVVERVAGGQSHLGLVGARRGDERDLAWIPFLKDEIVLAVPPGSDLASRQTLPPSELLSLPVLQREQGSGTRSAVESFLEEHGVRLPPAGRGLTLGSTQALLQAVAAGLGVGFVSLRALRAWSGPQAPGVVRLAGLPFVRQLWLIHRRDLAQTSFLGDVLAFLQQWAAEHADPG